jgi:L-asparaginase
MNIVKTKSGIVHFILTGGTIDSFYNGKIDTVEPFKKSSIPRAIDNLNLHIKTKFTQVCMKDSRHLTEKDMNNVYNTIKKSKDKYFIVCHGTYCMPDTARYLAARLKKHNKTIIFTGSMVPIGFPASDAMFNLGFSISEIFHLESGIYVSMNGKIFSPNEIAKLIGKGQFISIYNK